MPGLKIGIIGSGNVAFHLSKAFLSTGNDVSIYRRSKRHDKEFSSLSGLQQISNIDEFPADLQYYILAVNDDSIKEVAISLKDKNGIILHTSGSVAVSEFNDLGFESFGVFYPLQSFSINRRLVYKEIPVMLEINDENKRSLLETLANEFSVVQEFCTSDQRKKLHLAAVIVNNFVNHLYSQAESYLESDQKFKLLLPLIKETTARLKISSARDFQTGPAVRGDDKILETHMELLNEHPELKVLYQLMSKSISSNR